METSLSCKFSLNAGLENARNPERVGEEINLRRGVISNPSIFSLTSKRYLCIGVTKAQSKRDAFRDAGLCMVPHADMLECAAARSDFFLKCYPTVKKICRMILHNKGDVYRDIAQDAMVKILENYCSIRNKDKAKTWIYAVTRNICYDYLRKNKDVLLNDSSIVCETECAPPNKSVGTSSMRSSCGDYQRIEDKFVLDYCKKHLAPTLWNVLVLFEIEGMSHRDIARELGCTEENSRTRLKIARRELSMILKRLEQESPRQLRYRCR